jgi:hypothetical protein
VPDAWPLRSPITGIDGCRARAASGHAARHQAWLSIFAVR